MKKMDLDSRVCSSIGLFFVLVWMILPQILINLTGYPYWYSVIIWSSLLIYAVIALVLSIIAIIVCHMENKKKWR